MKLSAIYISLPGFKYVQLYFWKKKTNEQIFLFYKNTQNQKRTRTRKRKKNKKNHNKTKQEQTKYWLEMIFVWVFRWPGRSFISNVSKSFEDKKTKGHINFELSLLLYMINNGVLFLSTLLEKQQNTYTEPYLKHFITTEFH